VVRFRELRHGGEKKKNSSGGCCSRKYSAERAAILGKSADEQILGGTFENQALWGINIRSVDGFAERRRNLVVQVLILRSPVEVELAMLDKLITEVSVKIVSRLEPGPPKKGGVFFR